MYSKWPWPFCSWSLSAPSPGQERATALASLRSIPVDTETIALPVVEGKDIRFARISSSQGLSQVRVSDIVQDDQGFIWFRTWNGLNRYDGYNFKVFKHDPEHPESLSGVYIFSLFKDRAGTIWVGTDQFSTALTRLRKNSVTIISMSRIQVA